MSEQEKKQKAEETSRREFLRKSAEVAAVSLFGVLGFDAVANKVLEQLSETRAAGKLSDVAAEALKQNKLHTHAIASATEFHCDSVPPYNCTPTRVSCGQFTPDGCDSTSNPYGCTTRDLGCGEFECGTFNCTGTTVACQLALYNCHSFNPNYRPPGE